MSIKISVRNSLNLKSVQNHVFFTNEKFRINEASKLPVGKFASFISKFLSSTNLDNKNFLSLNVSASQKVILIKMKSNQSSL